MKTFNDNLKIYLIKNDHVKLTVRISDNCAREYHFSIETFEQLLEGWNTPDWLELEVLHDTSIVVEDKGNYVKFTSYKDGLIMHHRITFDDMIQLGKEYFRQKNNKMYWDQYV